LTLRDERSLTNKLGAGFPSTGRDVSDGGTMTQEANQMTMKLEDVKRLEDIGNELDHAMSAGPGTEVDLCSKYKLIRPILVKALPIVRLIPKIGKQLADVIEMLMGIADQYCPI
jgi:hypothetical protein